jgi:transcriptional regulator with XRE-family HTH domain
MCQLSVNTGFYATVNTGFNNNYNNLMEYKEFANRLKSLQLEKGIKTQIELSRWLCFSRSIVSEWMRGECLPSMDTAIKLSEKFGCNAQWLLTGKGKKTIDEEIITQGFLESANLTNEQITLIKSMVTQFEQNNPKSSENNPNKPLTPRPENVGGGGVNLPNPLASYQRRQGDELADKEFIEAVQHDYENYEKSK